MTNEGWDDPTTTSSTGWIDLPHTLVNLNLPAGGRVVNARLTAMTACYGRGEGYCIARMVAAPASGPWYGLGPIGTHDPNAEHTNWILDTNLPGSGNGAKHDIEGHAMEQSRRLPPGAYVLRVQVRVSTPATKFFLDDYHFAVEESV